MSIPTGMLKLNVKINAGFFSACQEFTFLNQYPVISGEALNLAMATSSVSVLCQWKASLHFFSEFQKRGHMLYFDAHIFKYMLSEKQSRLRAYLLSFLYNLMVGWNVSLLLNTSFLLAFFSLTALNLSFLAET